MKIYPGTRVYVLCPASWFTGGPTLLHQLASQLLALGIDAQMVYLPPDGKKYDHPVSPEYEKYHVGWSGDICDDEKNILIVFETYPWGLSYGKRIRKVLWWLSVDNHFESIARYVNSIDIKKVTTVPMDNIYVFGEKDIIHWCQSEYARQFVRCNGVPEENIFMVEDYLSHGFLKGDYDLSQKKNIVVYNPKKGMEFTEKIIEQRPDIDWRPIQDMTPEQVKELLLQAKVYIDFGNHPGKDRIPREAALSGCVVITGRRGAAANEIDIPIPVEYKLSEYDIGRILDTIDGVFTDFLAAYQQQYAYRQHIKHDFLRFVEELTVALEITGKRVPLWSAVLNDEEGQGLEIAKALLELKEEYNLQFIIDDKLANPAFVSRHIQVEKKRRYLRLSGSKIEILSSDDADFLYQEGRIRKVFAWEGMRMDGVENKLPNLQEEDLLLV